MSHVTTKRVLTHARNNGYAIPAFLAGNLEMVIGQIVAAEKTNAPLIMCFNQNVTPKIPMEVAVPMMVRAAEHARIPVATILDHGLDFDSIEKCIILGISSVMFDGSQYDNKENIRMTKEVVKLAKCYGVSVEAELGSVGGSVMETTGSGHAESSYTDVSLVKDFVTQTGIDQLAISFGNMHGIYRGESKLDLNIVRQCYEITDIPLVMHGGSGLSLCDYVDIIKSGISKINYYSVMGKEGVIEIKECLCGGCSETIYHDLISESISVFERNSTKIYNLFGCCNQAKYIPGTEKPQFSTPYSHLVEELIKNYSIKAGFGF